MNMLLIATLISLLGPSPVPVADPNACITMNTEKLPLNKRVSPLDSISFKVEKSNVKLCYGRPSLKGRNMIGGEAVPYGKIWRTGSNEPTMIHTDGPLDIAGVKVPAGTYSLYTVPGEKEWEVIVNKSITQWGHESTYTPEVQAQEVGRGKVKPETLKAPVEKLTFTAEPDAQKTKHLVLEWQTTKLAIPLK
jgi:hypothetical protein